MKTDFSRLAPIYDLLGSVVFLGSLRRSQNHFLNVLDKPSKVLILGGGTGTFLIDLLKNAQIETVDYVDISPGMIDKAQKKFVKSGIKTRVNFHCGGPDVVPGKNYDLICTNYFLDCFNDETLSELIPELAVRLKEKGVFLFTDFHEDEKASFFKKRFIRFLYIFFNITCRLGVKKLPKFKSHFAQTDLTSEREAYYCGGLLKTVLFRKN